MNRIRMALFNDRAAAEPVRAHLLQAGVPAEIHNEPWLARLWFVSKSRAGVRIEVPAHLSDTTEKLLLAWDAEGPCFTGIRCPECGSMRVDFPQFTEKSFTTNLAIGFLAGIGLVEKDYYCEHCHFMWPKPRATSQPVRKRIVPVRFIGDGAKTECLVTIAKPGAGGLTGNFPSTKPTGINGSPLEKPARFHRFKWWRRIWGKAPWVCGILVCLGRAAGLAEETNLNLPAVAVAPHAAAGDTVPIAEKSETPTYFRDVLPVLISKCARCHNDQNPVLPNWLDYHTAFGDRTEIGRRVWQSWKGSYFKQPMPAGNNLETQTMTEDERRLIQRWVAAGAPRGEAQADTAFHTKAERIEHGRRLFGTVCAPCHQAAGQGVPAKFPPLANSDFLNADKQRAIQTVVHGLQGELVVNGRKFNNAMPQFPLDNQAVANVLTYVYNSFGNSGKEVTPAEVRAVRAEKAAPEVASQTSGAKATETKSLFE